MGSSLYRVINPATVISEQEPLLHVQANIFSDRKMCLTIVWHHSIGDMQTLMMFMTTWSNALAGLQQTASPLWVEDRAAYLETMLEDRGTETPIVRWMDDQELAEFVAFMETKATDQKRVHFYFTSTELRRMREEFRQRTGCLLSTNDALCAHMWSLIDGCDRRDHDRTLAIAVNFRPRVGLPSSLAGNMISNVAFPCAPGRCANDVAREIRYLINNFATLQMDHFATEGYIAARGGSEQIDRFLLNALDPVKGSIVITTWTKFGLYRVNFGGEPPFFVSQLGSTAFPLLCSICEAFDNSGLIFSAPLSTAAADAISSPASLEEIHRYRENIDPLPQLSRSLGWLG